MNRIQYLLTAKTQYNIHSPWVFDLYNQVLSAHLRSDILVKGKLACMVYKLVNHFAIEEVVVSKDFLDRDAIVRASLLGNDSSRCVAQPSTESVARLWLVDGNSPTPQTPLSEKTIILFYKPHATHADETLFNDLYTALQARISIDLFDIGLLIFDTRLHKQKFILR